MYSSGGYGHAAGTVGLRQEILEFNYETESWTMFGKMKEAVSNHGVSVVSFEDYEKWCK